MRLPDRRHGPHQAPRRPPACIRTFRSREHGVRRGDEQRLPAGHLEQSVDVKSPVARNQGGSQDEYLGPRLGKPGTRIQGIGIADGVNGHDGAPDRHLPQAVRAGDRHPEIGGIVQVHEDVERLPRKIGQPVRPGLGIDIVHVVLGQEVFRQEVAGFRLPDEGDGAARPALAVSPDQRERTGRILGQLLHVGDRIPDHRLTLMAGDGRKEDGQKEDRFFHLGHICCKISEISLHLQR